jgi:hypothetical protein
MKQKKTRFDDYDDDGEVMSKDNKRRRPVRNWTKAFVEHQDDYDEYDDFHNYRIKS